MGKLFSKKTVYYIFMAIIALGTGIAGGIFDILQPQGVVVVAEHLGYPLYFFTLLGIFKILGGIALLLPKSFDKLKEIAYVGFSFDFIFASYSHFSVGDGFIKIITPLILLLILGLSYILKNRF